MTNFGALAILALPGLPERQLRFLLALETVTVRDGGWREVETGVLAGQAHQSVKTACKARAELVKAALIEYRPGTGPGHPGKYRLLVDVDKPPKNAARDKPGNDPARDNPGNNAARVEPGTNVARVNPGKQAPGSLATEPRKPTPSSAVTSANASIALEPIALEPSSLRAARRLDGHAEGAPNRQGDDDDFQVNDKPGPGQAPRPGPGYGLCPACGHWYAVREGFGRIARHNSDIRGEWSRCPGSRQLPAEPVPCARCGTTGVALAGYSGLCEACRRAEAAEAAP